MIEGMIQEVEYASSSAPISIITKKEGVKTKPDSAPTIIIYDPDGDSLVSSTSMTAKTVGTVAGTGFLTFKTQTANFTVGATLSGGTSGATAKIERVQDSGTTGILTLSNIFGTFADTETITDNGTHTGSAKADGAAWSCEYYYNIDASSTTNYSIGENYCGKVTMAFSSTNYHEWIYFDVVYHTFMEPIVHTQYIDIVHPDWKGLHPDGENAIWQEQIKAAHAELARRIRKLGNRGAFIVKREELFQYELAFVEAEIATRLTSMPKEDRDWWAKRAVEIWNGRGEFAYDSSQDDTEIDTDVKVISSRFTR